MKLAGFVEVSEILRSGVYALLHRGQVIYIGKSKSMLSRIYSHRNLHNSKAKGRDVPWWIASMLPGIQFDEIHVRPCSLEALDSLEREMIELYRPKYNIRMNENLAKAPVNVPLRVNGIPLMLNARSPAVSVTRRV